jgi:hypothetical protein
MLAVVMTALTTCSCSNLVNKPGSCVFSVEKGLYIDCRDLPPATGDGSIPEGLSLAR